jgi:large subunit GTPase 1
VIVQIVDARNPLLFRSEDLESYVRTVDARKQNLLLINKADMMTHRQRKAWADYLNGAKIPYQFFSASLAKEENEAQGFDEDPELEESEALQLDNEEDEDDQMDVDVDGSEEEREANDDDEGAQAGASIAEDDVDDDTRILTVNELESILLRYAPDDAGKYHRGCFFEHDTNCCRS